MSATMIWVGGSSALARTYFEEVHQTQGLHVIVAAPARPRWTLPTVGVDFISLDLLDKGSVESFFTRLEPLEQAGPSVMVIGVRLSLVWAGSRQTTLATHLGRLIENAASAGCLGVLHISSVAVADHVVEQHNVSESTPLPPIEADHPDYGRFKRRSESFVADECAKANARALRSTPLGWTHLRISGIFSNDPACIQCTAVRNQALVSCYSRTCIDFNSSANVAHAIALIVARLAQAVRIGSRATAKLVGTVPDANSAAPAPASPKRVYYYTRATDAPVPYGSLVADFRSAHNIRYGVWLPASLYLGFVSGARAMCALCSWLPLAQSLGYLLAVSVAEHTFDCSRFRADFPELKAREETILECFVRIRRRQAEAMAPKRRTAGTRARVLAVLLAALAVVGLALVVLPKAEPWLCELLGRPRTCVL